MQCLALSGSPSSRPNLVHFASHITKSLGLLVCGEVSISDGIQMQKTAETEWLRKHKIKAFHQIVQSMLVHLHLSFNSPFCDPFPGVFLKRDDSYKL